MPETYIEPLTDRFTCFQCNKAAPDKKKLLKCGGCQAITYCGQACQVEDRPRHKWNCVPVMVTEIEGMGRGLVAARDIEVGELIFKDKSAIKLPMKDDDDFGMPGSDSLKSLMHQIENLPSEARLQFYKLKTPLDTLNDATARLSRLLLREKGHKELKILLCNGTDDDGIWRLYLNMALTNHSCAPNAAAGLLQPDARDGKSDKRFEFRAIKDIKRGEEVTISYLFENSLAFKENRAIELDQIGGFECKCSACSGDISEQNMLLKEIFMLNHFQLDTDHLRKDAEDWAREAKVFDRITELTLKTDIGRVTDKTKALDLLVIAAQMARDQDLLRKALATWEELIENTKLEELRKPYEDAKKDLSQWTKQLKSKRPPKKKEIVAFLGTFTESEIEESQMSKLSLIMGCMREFGDL